MKTEEITQGNIVLDIKAKHFKDSSYEDICNCPLARAGKEQFMTPEVTEGAIELTVDGTDYLHDVYTDDDFKADMAKAIAASFDETIIRQVDLTQKISSHY